MKFKIIKLYTYIIACYFSSLVQVLFFIPNIQEKILNFDVNKNDIIKQYLALKNGKESETALINLDNIDRLDENEKKKLIASKELVVQM